MGWNTAQISRLANAGSDVRMAVMGTSCTHESVPAGTTTSMTAAVSAISDEERLVAGGMEEEWDSIARFVTADFAGPAVKVGDKLTVSTTGEAYRVRRVERHPLDPETKLMLSTLR